MPNKNVRNVQKQLLSDNWYVLHKYSFEYQKEDGTWEVQHREAYDRGNGAVILLYNKKKKQGCFDTPVSYANLCKWQ